MSKITAGMKVIVDEQDAKVVADPKGGWVTVKFADKALGEKKVHVGAVTPKPGRAAKAVAVEGETVDRLVPADLAKYTLHETKTASGRKHLDVNDDTATKLREKNLDQTYAFAAKTLGQSEQELREKYANLNVGMQRMNLGNRIRAAFKAAEVASVGLKELKKASA